MKTKKKIIRRNALETKERILREATKVFAKYGFAGTPISALIKASRVNQRMIYHYFEDKNGLYRAIFLQQWGELKDWFDRAFKKRIEQSGAHPPTSRELLVQALEIFFDFMSYHQNFVRLMMWEGLEGGHVSRSIWTDIREPLFVQMEFLITQAQKEGGLSSKADPAHLIISFLGAISFYFAYALSLSDMIKKNPLDLQALAERKIQVLDLLEGLYRK